MRVRIQIYVLFVAMLMVCPSVTTAQVRDGGSGYVRLTNLPHVYVNTFDGKSISSKTTYKYATMVYVDEEDNVITYDSMEIRGRGNSTWGMSKKPYKIKFNEKVKLLGKGYANCKPWTLLANHGDKSLIRNAITSEMGAFLGLKNNPGAKFVDLTLNGTYLGNYQISDHVDVRPHRVNVTEQEVPLPDDSDISGGYLLEVDGFHDGNCFHTNRSVYIRIHYPDEADINAAQNQYIRNYVNDFETVLFGKTFADEKEGYRTLVDSTSLIAWFLATEVSANIDGYYSSYFYKDQGDDKLYFGPLWDYDIAYDNDTRITPNAERLMTDYGYGDMKTWVNQMWKDPWFGKKVCEKFNEALDNGLVEFMYAKIDSLGALLDESQKLNYKKWGINARQYHEVVLYSSYSQYLTYIKSFIDRHTSWLRTAFESKKAAEPEPPTRPFVAGNHYYRFVNKGSGTVFDILDQDTIDGSICGWNNDLNRKTGDWVIRPVGEYFHITSRCGGMALNDPASAGDTGQKLNLAKPDTLNARQLWTLVPQGEGGYYNVKNRYTGHTANLSGGGKNDGTSVLSYTSDAKDATSNNRLWKIVTNGDLPEEPDGIEVPDAFDYALAYDQHAQRLHFGAEDRGNLNFVAVVYSTTGMKVGQFRADESFDVAHLPAGIYVVTWTAGHANRSVKFARVNSE